MVCRTSWSFMSNSMRVISGSAGEAAPWPQLYHLQCEPHGHNRTDARCNHPSVLRSRVTLVSSPICCAITVVCSLFLEIVPLSVSVSVVSALSKNPRLFVAWFQIPVQHLGLPWLLLTKLWYEYSSPVLRWKGITLPQEWGKSFV